MSALNIFLGNTIVKAAAFVVAFLIAIILMAPIGAILPEKLTKGRMTSGTLSSAHITGPLTSGSPLMGTLDIVGNPFSLLGLSYIADFSAEAPGMSARGNLDAGILGNIVLSSVNGTLDMSLIALPLPLTGDLRFQNIDIEANSAGICLKASGSLSSNALERSREVFSGWVGPALRGSLSCSQGVIEIALNGERGNEAVSIALTMGLAGYNADISVRSRNEVLARNLKLIGFQETSDGLLTGALEGKP